MEVERPLTGGVLLNDGLVPMHRALWLASGAGSVVHYREVVLRCVYGGEVRRRLAHLLVVVEVLGVDRRWVATIFVYDDDVLEIEQLRDNVRDSPAQVRLSDQYLRA